MQQKLRLKKVSVKGKDGMRRTVAMAIAQGLLTLMRSHIGRKKAIGKPALFQAVYAEPYDPESYEHFAKWDYVKRAMHVLRARSNCFVIGECTEQGWTYFVVSSETEAGTYVTAVEHNVRGLRKLQKRAVVAAKQQWHTKEWKIEGLRMRTYGAAVARLVDKR